LNEPPRPRLSKERGHFFGGAATPPSPRRGIFAPNVHGKSPNSTHLEQV